LNSSPPTDNDNYTPSYTRVEPTISNWPEKYPQEYNVEDPITFEPLDAQEIVTIKGQHFGIKSLKAWIRVNPTNPLTNLPFTQEGLNLITKEHHKRINRVYAQSLEHRFPNETRICLFYRLSFTTRTLVTIYFAILRIRKVLITQIDCLSLFAEKYFDLVLFELWII
jgi:hypothetical protein